MADASQPIARRARPRKGHGASTTLLEAFPNLSLLRQDGTTVSAESAFKGKRHILFFFAAHFIPSCQRFTPQLADFYNANAERFGFEIVFVSDDRSESKMLEFFQNRCSNYVFRHNKVVQPPPTPPPKNVGPVERQSHELPGNGDGKEGLVDSSGLRHRLHPNDQLEVVTTTTTTTMSYSDKNDKESRRTKNKLHPSDDDDDDGENGNNNNNNEEPATSTTQKTTTARTTAQEAMALLEKQEAAEARRAESTVATRPPVLEGHTARPSALAGYAPREPIASGHANWLALPYSDAQGKVGKWLRRHLKVRSTPRLVLVDGVTGQLLVSEARVMVLRDPAGDAFPWPGADKLLQAEHEAGSQRGPLMRYPFLFLSLFIIVMYSLYACARRVM